MAIEPLATKALTGLGKPLLTKARQQWKRRGASPLITLDTGTVDRELEEALGTLTGDAAALPGWLLKRLKAAMSARPDVFDDVDVREWLRIPEVRETIKSATLATVTQESIDMHRAEAERLYASANGDADWYGGVLFDYAVAFLSLTLAAKTSAGDRLGIDAGNRNTARLASDIADVRDDIAAGRQDMTAKLQQILEAQTGGEFPADIVGEYILAEVAMENRWRALDDPGRLNRVVLLGERVRDGDLRQAPTAARVEAMRLAAATLARADRMIEAVEWLDAAVAAGATDVESDRARVALCSKDWDVAAALLRDRADRLANSLAVDVIRGRDGNAKALDYVDRHLAAPNMTGFLLPSVATWMAAADRWDDAERLYVNASDEQIEENPVILFNRARLRIALMGPADQRLRTVENLSSVPRPSMIRDDAEGVRLLAAARADLAALADRLPADRYPAFAVTIDTHLVFLDLLSGEPEAVRAATDRLHDRLADYATVIDYAWLALEFRIDFDESPLRAKLDRTHAIEGWDTPQLVTAFMLAMRDDKSGSAIATFIDENRERLVEALGAGFPIGIEIEALARQGRIPEGRARLEGWRPRLDDEVTGRLETLLAEQEGGNPRALRLARFEATDAEPDLLALINALSEARDDRLADYSAIMWRRRHRTEDAVRACDGFFNAGRDGPLDAFLREIGTGVNDDPRLAAHAAWSSYRAGELTEAEHRLAPLRLASPDNRSLRQLEINIALEGGDWRKLTPLVRQDLERKECRTPQQLLQAAQLAHAVDDPIADDLTRAAAAAAPDDANVLVAAFTQAMRRGRDWEKEANGWLRRAIELSGDAGPLQRRKLRDLIELRNEHFRRGKELDGLVMAGDLPLVMVARPLGTTLSEMILSRLAANVTIDDGRRRLCLPFVAGNRLEADMTGITRVGFDPNAILALQLCGLLEAALDAFPEIVIPAGTLPSMFNDLTRADRSQPSRVDQAVRIKALVDDGRLRILPDISSGGDAFDDLYAAAERLDAYVVHAPPLYVADSLMEEERDATPFCGRLASPGKVAAALASLGETSADEAERAAKALGRMGVWPAESEPDLDRPLVVDGTSLHALDDAGMLEPMLRAGVSVFVDRSVMAIAEHEIRQRADSQTLGRAIETVRATLRSALTSGKAVIGAFRRDALPRPEQDEDEDERIEREQALTPLTALLQDGSSVDVVVSGDRMINRHGVFTDQSGRARHVLTIIDVINHLAGTGAIPQGRKSSAIRKLREAGVAMIPTSVDEIFAAAAEGNWSHGPPRSLRAICDSIHLPLLRGALRLPDDRHWLDGVTQSMTLAIRRCWAELEPKLATQASDFLFLNLPAVAGWIQGDPDPGTRTWADGVVTTSHAMLSLPFELPVERIEAYHAWYDSRVRPRLEGRDSAVLRDVRSRLGLVVARPFDVIGDDGEPLPPDQVVRLNRFVLGLIPKVHVEELVEDAMIHAALGGTPPTIHVDEQEVAVTEIAEFLRDTLDGQSSPLTAVDGTILAPNGVASDDGTVAIMRPWGRLRFHMAGLFGTDAGVRAVTFDRLAAESTIAPSSAARWRSMIASEPLPPDLMPILMDEFRATPETFRSTLRESEEPLTFADFSALDDRLLSSILDIQDRDADLATSIAAVVTAHAAAPGPRNAARTLAPLAVSPDFHLSNLVSTLADEAVAALSDDLLADGDAFSLIAAFEACCARPASPACLEAGGRIIDALFDKEEALDRIAHDFCIAARLVIAGADLVHSLREWPLAHRRCTLLAHAGNVARALGDFEFDRPESLAAANSWLVNRFRISGYLERAESPDWTRDWLTPLTIKAQMLRRLVAALETIEESARPTAWVERLRSGVEIFNHDHGGALLMMAGPLDSFSPVRDPVPAFETAIWAPQITTTEPARALNVLYVLVAAAGRPDETGAMIDVIVDLVGRCVDELRDPALQLSLVAAAKWKSTDLADRIMTLVLAEPEARGARIGATAEFAIAASAAEPDNAAMKEAALERLDELASGPLDREAASKLANLLDLTSNVIPVWAPSLERIRTAALLAA